MSIASRPRIDGRPFLAAAVLFVALHLVTPATTAAAAAPPKPDAPGAELYARAKEAYAKTRKSVRSVRFDYSMDLNGMTRQSRYARDGECEYQGGITVLPPDGLCMPDEVAWDGKVVFERNTVPNQIGRSKGRARFHRSSPTPEDHANIYVGVALGVDEPISFQFHYTGAREVKQPNHGACVELTFDVSSKQYGARALKMVTLLAERYGYLPCWTGLSRKKDGDAMTELLEVRYAEIKPAEVKGAGPADADPRPDARARGEAAAVYFPVEVTVVSMGGKERGGNTIRITVDEQTLEVNRPVPPKTFVIEPWPNEGVYDWDADTRTKPKDPAWSPIGQVGFPWNDWFRRIRENETKGKANVG